MKKIIFVFLAVCGFATNLLAQADVPYIKEYEQCQYCGEKKNFSLYLKEKKNNDAFLCTRLLLERQTKISNLYNWDPDNELTSEDMTNPHSPPQECGKSTTLQHNWKRVYKDKIFKLTKEQIDSYKQVKLKEINEENDNLRNISLQYENTDDYTSVINIYEKILSSKGTIVFYDYTTIGWFSILSKNFEPAISYLKKGLEVFPDNLYMAEYLAHAYLFNGNIELAKNIYLKNKGKQIETNLNWNTDVSNNFKMLQSKGLNNEHFQEILDLMNK
jgi:tetratricopeptide (TPR) repeat protein